jgi:3-dehydroquinate dehydratase type I
MDRTIAPLICISIAQPDARSVIQAAEGVPADVVEVRLDAMQQPEISPIRAAITRPLLCTCRPRWEGGSYDGDEETRIGLLAEAVEQGADYVDIELAAREEFRERLRRACATTQCELIVSHHDFDATPDARTLETILAAQMAAGADIGKIVTTARTPGDVARILALQAAAAERGIRLCAFCMGRAGRISRVACLHLGGFMSYAAVDPDHTVAPGQIDALAMRRIMALLDQAG